MIRVGYYRPTLIEVFRVFFCRNEQTLYMFSLICNRMTFQNTS